MPGNPQVFGLLEQMLDSGKTPEEVCRDCPELLPEVRERWQEFCLIDAHVRTLLPGLGTQPCADTLPSVPRPAGLPCIPGYEVEAVLGRGGMGVVYRARHLRLNRPVALKMLLAGDCAGPSDRARFQREAEAVANLRHANIVQVYDVGEQDGRPYFTMEIVEGGSLADRLAGVPQPAREAAALVVTLAQAVSAAHQGGIVHRDLKPANVLLTPPTDEGLPSGARPSWGTAKISDFGLARRVEGGQRLTQSGAVLGTPSYMAPEQARGRRQALGPPVDIYALGAILYELLTGRPPFQGETAAETVVQVLSQDPLPPSRLNARVPRDLETICLKCLHKEPHRRYASAAALAEDLRCFLNGEAIAARPEGRLERLARGVRRRPTLVVGLTAGVLLAAALVGGGLWLHGERAANERAKEQMQRLDQARREQEVVLKRMAQARRERQQAERLDAIHLNRAGVVSDRLDVRPNAERAAQEYEAAFRDAGFGQVGDDPAAVAARIKSSTIRDEVVAALDDWAVCARSAAADKARQRWLLEVLRRADPSPTQLRQRLRDPTLWEDRAALSKLAETALAEEPSAQLLVALAERLLHAGADAVPFLRRVQRERPGDFWANFGLGVVLLGKNPGESVRYLQAAVALRPRTAVVHDSLGVALLGADRPDEAIEHFQQALHIDPGFANAHNNLGFLLGARGRLDEAIAHYRRALRSNPLQAEVHCNLGGALIKQGRHDEALEHVQQAIRIAPRLPQAHGHLCTLLKARGGPQAVIAHYRQVLSTDPKLAPAHAYLGIALGEAGQMDEAIDRLREALRLDSKLTAAHHNLGLALTSRGQYDEAVKHLQQAVTLNPRIFQAHVVLGQVLLNLGRLREARDATRRGLDLHPPDHPQRPTVVRELKYCEDLLALEARLPALLRGEDRPGDTGERLRFAEVCRVKKRYIDAARLFEKAFADKPPLPADLQATLSYNAARAAALAGCGQGEDGNKLSTEERARWRRQARAWLQAALAVSAGKLDGGTAADRARVKTRLTRWQADPDLAGVREPRALDSLSAEERAEWLALWKEVGAVLKRAAR
jgi:serine/threonine-protein kinase